MVQFQYLPSHAGGGLTIRAILSLLHGKFASSSNPLITLSKVPYHFQLFQGP